MKEKDKFSVFASLICSYFSVGAAVALFTILLSHEGLT